MSKSDPLFRWNAWNLDHATSHGVSPPEAESVVRSARRPYPHGIADEKWIAIGLGAGGRVIQVVFLYDPDGVTVYIVHARPLTDREKKRFRRRSR
jgi:uncharacterized DUF497 family protein